MSDIFPPKDHPCHSFLHSSLFSGLWSQLSANLCFLTLSNKLLLSEWFLFLDFVDQTNGSAYNRWAPCTWSLSFVRHSAIWQVWTNVFGSPVGMFSGGDRASDWLSASQLVSSTGSSCGGWAICVISTNVYRYKCAPGTNLELLEA